MFDVFISYGHQDQAWVRTVAENLYRAGLEVFYDEWEIGPGDVLVHRLDEGIRTSRNGILIVSPASLARPWVAEEYAAMLTRTVAGQQHLIPVLLGDAELPPFLAARVWVDFRHADGPEYDRRVSQLIAALRGERPPRPAPGDPHQHEPRPKAQPVPQPALPPESSSRSQHPTKPLEVFFSYVKEDERLVKHLQNQLALLQQQQLITAWHAGKILPGQRPSDEMMKHLNTAQLILLLISPDFVASEQQAAEVKRALERSAAGEALVIPVLLRPTAHWQSASFGQLQAIPRENRAITEWPHRDLAFAQVAEEIGEAVRNLHNSAF